ncbi:MAG TPA: tRNA lysidine(34) synthetase TilS [Muricauda sp.]|uniref:tRNA(Ile)-lysidine synthase n=1 Tax=Flagellimonas aurea TaxID=2915619 RepID=A0ABS3G8V4_9FLAO|nr:tRNA lysidine(34) synthetase TilS [Allomuricauda aurea]MAO18804.1 tRNA lysidine(34) synthetase TilS [Allomuricauda sp.]MBC71359.1 tRNA lysidine(34) synthetase TilS [Allomuricauda sp.]MBO0355723.1 tRNA lysidine(34) synthetase TilS [Allomuricauda aurea]HBU78675.1 tRNA lysidine(34) synthetase TilS [Allomuricauda sp.]|tara:strand:+ start:714 stop:2021 length:1308 start_codon:yes stop_codon:yes gene_type:complete
MVQKFKEHVAAAMPFLNGKKLLLACSGGLDSVVLAHLCKALKFDFALAHCNFSLRGTESDGDEDFVRELASTFEIDVYVKQFDTEQYAEEQRLSVQMAARELRYKWFDELLQSKRYDYVLTAHHADDSLETFLINLSRGTGIEGLSGIPQVNGNVVRPLLPFSRNEIIEYAKSESIQWREDSSNASVKYLRNKIRHEIVPGIKELNPTFLQNFQHTQHHLRQINDLVNNHLNELKSKLFQQRKDKVQIKIAELQKLQPLDAYLYGLFNGYGFSEWSDVKDLLAAESGKQVFSKTHRLIKDRQSLILAKIERKESEAFEIHSDKAIDELPIKISLEDVETFEKQGQNVVFLDKEKLNFPLVLRNWKKGDYFYPFGMKGKKKLSKFFKDEKMDLISKEKQWLLCSGDDIVWIVGRRADERFKVDGSTMKILKITQFP